MQFTWLGILFHMGVTAWFFLHRMTSPELYWMQCKPCSPAGPLQHRIGLFICTWQCNECKWLELHCIRVSGKVIRMLSNFPTPLSRKQRHFIHLPKTFRKKLFLALDKKITFCFCAVYNRNGFPPNYFTHAKDPIWWTFLGPSEKLLGTCLWFKSRA